MIALVVIVVCATSLGWNLGWTSGFKANARRRRIRSRPSRRTLALLSEANERLYVR